MGGQGSGAKPSRKKWDQLENETIPSFEAFAMYRDMGHKRSCAKVAIELGKSNTIIERWCKRHGWVQRARRWDLFLDQKGQQAAVRETEKMRRRHIQIAMGLQQVGAKELKKLVDRAAKNGRALNVDQLIRIFEQGTKMERLNRGEPTDHTSTDLALPWSELMKKAKAE